MDSTPETRQLEEAPIGRLLLKLSLPAICGALVGATYNIVDRIFVAMRFGTEGLTAVTLAFPIMLIMLAFGMMIGVGSNTLISIRLGEKNRDAAERILGQAIFLFVCLSTFFSMLGLVFLDPLLYAFGASEKVMPMAREFLSIIIAGAIFQALSFGVNSFLRAEGKARIAMVTMLISAFINIVLDWFFLFVLRTGIWGAAVATVIAQACSTLWIIWYYLSGHALLRWRLKYIRFDFRLACSVALIGLPPLVMQSASCLLQGVQNRQLSHYGRIYGEQRGFADGGDIAISIAGILFVVFTMLLLPLLGIGQGLQPIAGYNTGARRFGRVRHALTLALISAFLFASTVYAVTMLFPDMLILPFIKPDAPEKELLIAIGSHAMRLFAALMPAVAVIVISSGYFQAVGHPKLALMLTVIRQVVLLIPILLILPYLLVRFTHFSGLDGIWLAHPISDFGAVCLTAFYLIREYRRLKTLIEGPKQEAA